MNPDRPVTWGLVIDILDTLERHGYHRADAQHAGRAIGLIADLAGIYQGTTREIPVGVDTTPPPPAAQPASSRPAPEPEKIAIAGRDSQTILAALDEAADAKRDHAAACPDCGDETCGTCQWRLTAAREYDSAARRLQDREVAGHSLAAMTPRHESAHAAPEREAER